MVVSSISLKQISMHRCLAEGFWTASLDFPFFVVVICCGNGTFFVTRTFTVHVCYIITYLPLLYMFATLSHTSPEVYKLSVYMAAPHLKMDKHKIQ